MTKPINPDEAVFLVLDKEDLGINQRIEETFIVMELLAEHGGEPRHELLFHGYDDDSRRIYQIPECVNLLRRIMLEVPQFIRVAGSDTFSMLLLGTAVKQEGRWTANKAWKPVLPDYLLYQLDRKED